MDSVPGTSTCSGVEHHLIFYSHSSQWSSSDCLPRQSSHSVVQDTVWNLFSHHPGNRTPLAPVPPPFYPHCPGLNGSCWKDYRIPSFSFYSYCPHVYSTSNTSIFSNIPMCLLAYLSGLNRWKNYKITFHVVWWKHHRCFKWAMFLCRNNSKLKESLPFIENVPVHKIVEGSQPNPSDIISLLNAATFK